MITSRSLPAIKITKRFAMLVAVASVAGSGPGAQSLTPKTMVSPITITLAGQSLIRSDIRETAPAALPTMQTLLKGDVIFSNFEAAVAQKGETIQEGRAFLAPPGALDALATAGFNLLALSGNHAFDLRVAGIQNTIREADKRKIVHSGTREKIAAAPTPPHLLTPKSTNAPPAGAA